MRDRVEEFDATLREHQRRLVHHIRFRISEWKHRTRDLATHRGFRQLEMLLRNRRQLVDDMAQSLAVGMAFAGGVVFASASPKRMRA